MVDAVRQSEMLIMTKSHYTERERGITVTDALKEKGVKSSLSNVVDGESR